MSGSSKNGSLFKFLTLICIAALFLVIAVGFYFIKKSDKSSSNTNSSEIQNNAESETAATSEAATDEVTTSADEVEPTEPVDPESDKIDNIIANMSLREKLCQMFIITPESLTGFDAVTASGDTTKSCLTEYPVGGLVYFSINLEDVEQTRSMLRDAKAIEKEIGCIPLFYAVDEEGGTVARCAEKLGTTAFQPMFTYKDQGDAAAYSNAYTIAKDISELGFNLDFAPVADTWTNPENTVIGQRAYSNDFKEAAKLVSAAVKGFNEGGVYCSLKHFPGHGDTTEDTHVSTATSAKTAEELKNNEYLPFVSGIEAGADMVMVGHISMTAFDSVPASISISMITDELRGKLEYDGVVITDSLSMAAVAKIYPPDELAVKSVLAGADILLMPEDFKTALTGLENAVQSGQISEERINQSVKRILELKSKRLELNK